MAKGIRVRSDERRLLRQMLKYFEPDTDVIEDTSTNHFTGEIDDQVLRLEVQRRRQLIEQTRAVLR